MGYERRRPSATSVETKVHERARDCESAVVPGVTTDETNNYIAQQLIKTERVGVMMCREGNVYQIESSFISVNKGF